MSSIRAVLRGRAWKLGDSVDTNQLAGGGLVVSSDPDENLKVNCLRALRPEFTKDVKPGDILVAGANFGCGSSRQSAVRALQVCGIQAVLAESVARIHRRNSIALGLPTFVVPEITGFVDDGDVLEVDYPQGAVRNVVSGRELSLARFPESVEQIYELGGILQVIVKKLASQGITAG